MVLLLCRCEPRNNHGETTRTSTTTTSVFQIVLSARYPSVVLLAVNFSRSIIEHYDLKEVDTLLRLIIGQIYLRLTIGIQ